MNRLFHQKAVNFEQDHPLYQKYLLPYTWFHPRSVLIIGAGTGNDVWVAEQAGAEHIDAVEIDPLIFKLGHPQHPYASPKVRTIVNDARSFMHHSSETRYDMIVYGTLDSHATLSMSSSIRLDNYVYTTQALEEAQRLLRPHGVVVLLFSVPTDWMAVRLLETARSAFGADSTRFFVGDNNLFNLMIVAGPGMREAIASNAAFARLLRPLPNMEAKGVPIPEDDWPYLYLRERGIPRLYAITLVVLGCIAFGAIFMLSPMRRGAVHPVFFLLGTSFLLLETKSVTTLSLLFGSTWLVNAVVFAAILTIALLANWLVMSRQWKTPKGFFAALIMVLLMVYGWRMTGLLRFGLLTKILAASLLIALPIFFSSVIFAILLKQTRQVGRALGSNLLGAVIGGFLEYTSMVWGLNALYLIAAGCYLIAAFYGMRYRTILA